MMFRRVIMGLESVKIEEQKKYTTIIKGWKGKRLIGRLIQRLIEKRGER